MRPENSLSITRQRATEKGTENDLYEGPERDWAKRAPNYRVGRSISAVENRENQSKRQYRRSSYSALLCFIVAAREQWGKH